MEHNTNIQTGSFVKFLFTQLNELVLMILLHAGVVLGYYYTFTTGVDGFENYKLYYLSIISLFLITILYWAFMFKSYWELKRKRSQ